MVEAYPLHWPVGYKRTTWRQNSRFNTAFAKARDGIVNEIKLMGGRNAIISTNIPLRNDGLPYAAFKAVDDTGVAVYFTYNNEQVVFACDKWKKVEENMQAIRKSIYSFRMMPEWGVSDLLKRAFTGFKALPESKEWWEILGVDENASQDDIKSAYRNLAKVAHPDGGGNNSQFQLISEAYRKGLKQTA